MTQFPPNSQNPDNPEAAQLLQKLRQKQGNWVEWGNSCAQLQKTGYNPQEIFEATGFEPIQQNQIIVGAQVYSSIEKVGVSETARSHYTTRGSDVLYELRLLTQEERATAAELILSHKLNADDAREIARAIKDYSRLRNLPSGFSAAAGDAVAYHAWKLARVNTDLAERSRLIARGLKFAVTPTARQEIEQLLVDFTVVSQRSAPLLPFYRLESEEELPRLIPVAGELPMASADLRKVPLLEETGEFRIVKFAGEQAWVPVPGWQVILSAEDPIGILCNSDRLPSQRPVTVEPVLVIIDRAARKWDENSYFVIDNSGELSFEWFESATELPLLGKVIVIVRPKRILDDEANKDVWEMDE